jgi:hypothetical protein
MITLPQNPIVDVQSEIDALKGQLLKIEQSCESWKKCQDGSYEMAMLKAGYDRVYDQITALKAQLP